MQHKGSSHPSGFAAADSLRPLIYEASPRMETGSEGAGEETRFVVLSFYQFAAQAGNTCTPLYVCMLADTTNTMVISCSKVLFFNVFFTNILQILTGKNTKSSFISIQAIIKNSRVE